MGKTSVGILAGLAGVVVGIILTGITAEEVYDCDVTEKTETYIEQKTDGYKKEGAAGGYTTEDDRQESLEYKGKEIED